MHSPSDHVLVVDDDQDIREMIARYLQDIGGFTVATAGDGAVALGLLSSGSFGAVVCDEMMPGLVGTDFLAQATMRGLTVPFIMMTGSPEGEIVRTALRLGAFDFLDKPIKLGEVLQVVRRAVEFGRRVREGKGPQDERMATLLRVVNGTRAKRA